MKIIVNIILLVFLGTSVGQAQTLDDYFKIAAQNNPGLQSKYKEFEAALKELRKKDGFGKPLCAVLGSLSDHG